MPLVFDVAAGIYNRQGINFSSLSHLDSIGLVKFDGMAGFINKDPPQEIDRGLLRQDAYFGDAKDS